MTGIYRFVLVSPDGQCQTVSLGAGRNAVINGRTLAGAHGNVLIHMQSINNKAFEIHQIFSMRW